MQTLCCSLETRDSGEDDIPMAYEWFVNEAQKQCHTNYKSLANELEQRGAKRAFENCKDQKSFKQYIAARGPIGI